MSRGLSKGDYEQLRRFFGGDEPIMHSGLHVKKTRDVVARKNETPEWMYNDNAIKRFLLKHFPRLETDTYQQERAGEWSAIIQLYFRMGYSDGKVAAELNKSARIPWTRRKVCTLVQRIRWAAAGLRQDGKSYSARKRGRPRKANTEINVNCIDTPLGGRETIVQGIEGATQQD